jgi:broad specificity phosphatase PhoE
MRRVLVVVLQWLILSTTFAASIAPSIASASDDLWKRLEAGGRVILMRHAVTTSGVGDPPGMRLDDCATQRNLTDQGRSHARAIGAVFRARRIDADRVLSSPWCRCIETAQLAFGRAQTEAALSNLFGRPENRERQVEALRTLVASHAGPGNAVLVTHGSTILALAGVSPDTGEMVVLAPQRGGKFTVEGRLTVQER